ncbi:aldehyde dehydrogenase iron-sulfur subunit [soil metagenome]
MSIAINGSVYFLPDDPRVSLLDLLRDRIGLTGTKVGCNQGACGACTVLVDGERVLSCLMLAVKAEGHEVRTIEGFGAANDALHPLQQAFVRHDGLQCGYCTPGQICSALAMLDEVDRGDPSHVSGDLEAKPLLTREEIRERMSGNLCRCGAHNGIVDAIEEYAAVRFV